MRDGLIVQQGPPEEIVSHPADEYVADFVQDVSSVAELRAGAPKVSVGSGEAD